MPEHFEPQTAFEGYVQASLESHQRELESLGTRVGKLENQRRDGNPGNKRSNGIWIPASVIMAGAAMATVILEYLLG